MGVLRVLALAVMLSASAPLGIGCDDDPPPAAAATHACPMHPEEQGGPGDKCGQCGMDLVPKERVSE